MRINLASLMVKDQEHALRFYTDVVGFVKKNDIPMGEFRWLTVTSPEGAEGVELVLPAAMGPITAVLFEDTCGNLINLVQPKENAG
jgi:predicted enzyme related to lactoylglutathione lyase